jgi:NADPH-dependent curcumin reductase
MTETIQRIVLASRPVGEPTLDNFRLEKLPIPQPGPGQMLLRTLWLSLDPYMRGRMSDAPSYAKPVGIGEVMEGATVTEVVASNLPRFAKGDIVVGRTGWQTHALSVCAMISWSFSSLTRKVAFGSSSVTTLGRAMMRMPLC